MLTELYKYIEDVKTNKIITGNEIKQAVSRFENDLLRDDIYFDEDKAYKAIKFISKLKHSASEYVNTFFILQPWQVFIVANIFGWIKKSNGKRKYKKVYIEVARKNGKTALSAALSLYALVADGEAKAEVVLAANSREQAKVCFDAVKDFSNKIDPNEAFLVISGKSPNAHRNTVKYNNNIIKVVSANHSNLDGMNCSLIILDEYHEARTNAVYNVLKSSQVMRSQPLFIIITTAGFNKTYPCYEYRTTAKDVLQGLKIDDAQFVAIFSLDVDDKWDDSKVWIKSNPCLGTLIPYEVIEEEITSAKNNISLETGVKTKTLNIWCDTLTTWIADRYILQASKDFDFNICNEETEIVVGIDLSSVSDITAVSYMFIHDEKFHFITKYYLPEDSLNSANDKEYYKTQHKKGNLTLTPFNVVDYDYILNDILTINSNHYITKLFYDSYNSTQFVIQATQGYLQLEPFSQLIGNFNRPTKEFERLVLQNKIVIQNNEITRWMMSNVFLKVDANGNVKPDKSKKDKKMDGVISMLMALGGWLMQPHYNVTII